MGRKEPYLKPPKAVKSPPPPAPPKMNKDRLDKAAEILEHQSNIVGKSSMLPIEVLWLVARALRGEG